MHYQLERYKDFQRFNEQYNESIYYFLLKAADIGYNEHFHWGRFEWMMCHSYLEIPYLEKVALFRDRSNSLVGLVTYDTCLDDSVYLIHSTTDTTLLEQMIDYAIQNYKINGKTIIKSNQNNIILNKILSEKNFVKTHKENSLLTISLDNSFDCRLSDKSYLPEGIHISADNFTIDYWKYQMVLHKGFNNAGLPKPWDNELLKPTPNENRTLKVFAYCKDEYCSHCGVWYTQGETAYIEPVATIPKFRNKGLAKTVVYEALRRAKNLGAKRAVVLSDQDFYFKIGFSVSSEIFCWEK